VGDSKLQRLVFHEIKSSQNVTSDKKPAIFDFGNTLKPLIVLIATIQQPLPTTCPTLLSAPSTVVGFL
jgi:hypothetical protein